LKLSVIIPTCGRREMLRKCLECLIPQLDQLPDEVESIVCDDGSESDTCAMIKADFPIVRWHEGPKRGPAANRNLGAAAARGEWLIFLDDDCIPAKDFLAAYTRAIGSLKDRRAALEGVTASPERPSLLWEAPHNLNGGVLISCNFAIRRDEFEKFGKFDERFPVAAFEDTEFAARFAAFGGKTVFVKDALVEHPLRPIPSAKKLALRWEGKVIMSLDYGASSTHVMLRLPWHVLRVIQSRFRGRNCSLANVHAALIFACEWLLVCWWMRGWMRSYKECGRSQFWKKHFTCHPVLPKYGF